MIERSLYIGDLIELTAIDAEKDAAQGGQAALEAPDIEHDQGGEEVGQPDLPENAGIALACEL